MISRGARVRELLCRTHGDGTRSYSALVSWDEAAATTVRLSLAEYTDLSEELASGKAFVMRLHAAPSVELLATRKDGAA